jgi:4-amino-4-deoxy-L-arabinose transferase-like glycosyltransferase
MRKKFLRLSVLPVTAWQPVLLYAVLLAGLATLLWFNLGPLTGGYSQSEAQALQAGNSWRYIFDHPLNAPFTIGTRLMMYLSEHNLLITRLVATGFGLATIVAFYLLVRLWHGERTAIMGSILFAASAWFLHVTRLGTPDVMFFMLLVLVAGLVWHKQSNNPLALLLSFGLGAALLYVPGMIWFIVVGTIWQWRTIDRMFKDHLWIVTLGALVFAAALVPLGLAIYQDPTVAKQLAGLPAEGWPIPLEVLRNLLDVPLQLFFSVPANPERWLAELPLLDYFGMAMLFLGGFVYARYSKLDRTRLLAITLLIGMILVSLGGGVSLSVLVPFIYILVAAGAGFLLERWFVVFPRNTIAQTTGLTLISLALLASVVYGVRHYFIAWPNAPETREVFVVQPVASSVRIKE